MANERHAGAFARCTYSADALKACMGQLRAAAKTRSHYTPRHLLPFRFPGTLFRLRIPFLVFLVWLAGELAPHDGRTCATRRLELESALACPVGTCAGIRAFILQASSRIMSTAYFAVPLCPNKLKKFKGLYLG